MTAIVVHQANEVADELIPSKVVRDGKVAVLYSPGFGAGWSTWDSTHAIDIMFDPVIVKYVEDGKMEELESYMAMRYPGVYLGGMDGLTIAWLKEGTLFRITEYDGSEGIECKEDDGWITA